MSIEVNNEYGKIDITNDVIAQVVGGSGCRMLWNCRYGF